jgi:ubiquinone/menaquinone biosynthesis C-methylase UbiE
MKLKIEPGHSTAYPFNVQYRIGRIAEYIYGGHWLDYGCADGGYTSALLTAGPATVSGVDVIPDRIEAARKAYPGINFYVSSDARLPFPGNSFDGVFMNEVFEHLADEAQTLKEIHRLLRPKGRLIIISPNRGFPFEGHTVHIGSWTSSAPTPIIPWLPKLLTDRWVTARNYWPKQLRRKIGSGGFTIVESGFIMPVFEGYPWVPTAVAEGFRRHLTRIDHLPGIQRLGVSNLVVAERSEVSMLLSKHSDRCPLTYDPVKGGR